MSQYKIINEGKCLICNKIVRKLEQPYEHNYDGGVDVLLYAFYGSKHVNHKAIRESTGSISVTPVSAVICDECLEEKGITN